MAIDFKKLGKKMNRDDRYRKKYAIPLGEEIVRAFEMSGCYRGSARVLVTGGRDYSDACMVDAILRQVATVREIGLLIEGGAAGADRLCSNWAEVNDVLSLRVEANWKVWGKSAGYRRNVQMVAIEPHICIAFPGGVGTADCVRECERCGVPVVKVPVVKKKTKETP